MPRSASGWCFDRFTISITVLIDAEITIPGDFPLAVEPGAAYFLGFTYVTGVPAATGWRIEWEISDDGGNMYQGESRPSVRIMPEVPETLGNNGQLRNGSIRGNVPSPTANRLYVADIYILQA